MRAVLHVHMDLMRVVYRMGMIRGGREARGAPRRVGHGGRRARRVLTSPRCGEGTGRSVLCTHDPSRPNRNWHVGARQLARGRGAEPAGQSLRLPLQNETTVGDDGRRRL